MSECEHPANSAMGMMHLSLCHLTVPHPWVMALITPCPHLCSLMEHILWDWLPRRPHSLESCTQSPERGDTSLRSHSKARAGQEARTPNSFGLSLPVPPPPWSSEVGQKGCNQPIPRPIPAEPLLCVGARKGLEFVKTGPSEDAPVSHPGGRGESRVSLPGWERAFLEEGRAKAKG